MAIAHLPTQLTPQLITPENFQPYGQVIFPTDDSKQFDVHDAQLVLSGIPRFYINNAPNVSALSMVQNGSWQLLQLQIQRKLI